MTAIPAEHESTLGVCLRLLRRSTPGEYRKISLGLGCALAGSLVSLAQPWPLKFVLDSVVGDKPLPAFFAAFSPGAASGSSTSAPSPFALLAAVCLSLLVIEVLRGAFNVYSAYLLNSAGLRMVFKIRCALFDHLQTLSLGFHTKTPVGDSMYRVTWDSYCVQTVFNALLVNGAVAAATLIGVLAVMATRDWRITLATLCTAIPLTYVIGRFERPMTDHAMRVHEQESRLSSRVQETMSSLRAVLAYTQERRESAAFRDRAGAALGANLRLVMVQTISQTVVGVVLAVGGGAVIWLGASRVLSGHLTAGDLVLLIAYSAMVLKPLETLAYTMGSLQNATAGGRRVFQILDAVPEVLDTPHAQPIPTTRGGIAFKNVTFSYPASRAALSDISLVIPPGRSVALVGPSGAGKSTLINLLLRFYDPSRGVIELDGHDTRAVTLQSLREKIALVTQEPLLFCASIGENIAYGKPGASQSEIEAASARAGIDEFITSLPNGYETELTEGGGTLSAGQKQRISIARAFLKDAPILVLDEPSSALDSETEEAITQGIRGLAPGRSTLIIAHRFSTIRFVDEIVVLENGRVKEHGTYAELLGRGGLFARLHAAQFGTAVAAATAVTTA